jgi:hypothetical protein
VTYKHWDEERKSIFARRRGGVEFRRGGQKPNPPETPPRAPREDANSRRPFY